MHYDNQVGITWNDHIPADRIPCPYLLNSLIILYMFRPRLFKNRLNRATASADKGGRIVPHIKPQYFNGWNIRTSFVGHGGCLIEVFIDAIDEHTRIVGDVKDTGMIMTQRR